MENIAQIIGIILVIVGVVGIARSALAGNLSIEGLVIPLILVIIGALLMRTLILG